MGPAECEVSRERAGESKVVPPVVIIPGQRRGSVHGRRGGVGRLPEKSGVGGSLEVQDKAERKRLVSRSRWEASLASRVRVNTIHQMVAVRAAPGFP